MHSKNWKFHKRFGIPQNEELIEGNVHHAFSATYVAP
jgi:hypothetical protein